MAHALFPLRGTSMGVCECGDLVDLPSAAIVSAAQPHCAGGLPAAGCRGRHSGRNAHFNQLTGLGAASDRAKQ